MLGSGTKESFSVCAQRTYARLPNSHTLKSRVLVRSTGSNLTNTPILLLYLCFTKSPIFTTISRHVLTLKKSIYNIINMALQLQYTYTLKEETNMSQCIIFILFNGLAFASAGCYGHSAYVGEVIVPHKVVYTSHVPEHRVVYPLRYSHHYHKNHYRKRVRYHHRHNYRRHHVHHHQPRARKPVVRKRVITRHYDKKGNLRKRVIRRHYRRNNRY